MIFYACMSQLNIQQTPEAVPTPLFIAEQSFSPKNRCQLPLFRTEQSKSPSTMTSRDRIAMASSATIFYVIVMAAILGSGAATKVLHLVHRNTHMADFIRTSCNVTLYPQVCVSSLSSYAGPLKPKKKDLVNAALQVSLVNAQNVSVWAAGLKTRRATMSKREKAALKDCMENFGDTTDQIHQSLAELKHLRRKTFKIQMSNVETWMSAALTDEDSCLDGFQAAKGRVKAMVTGRVHYLCKLISNALALVNTFAANDRGYEIDV